MALTIMKKRFADYYIESLKVADSMKKAGYKGNQKHLTTKGTDMLREDIEVKDYVRKRMEQKDNDIVASQNDILKYLSDCVNGKAKEKTYFTLKKGSKTHYEDELVCRDVPVKAKDRIKACEIMAKYHKMFGDNEDKQRPINIYNTIPRPEKKES